MVGRVVVVLSAGNSRNAVLAHEGYRTQPRDKARAKKMKATKAEGTRLTALSCSLPPLSFLQPGGAPGQWSASSES